MFTRLQRLVRDLAGRNDELLVGLVVAQFDAALEGVELAREVAADDGRAPGEALEPIEEVAARGDEHRHDLVVELAAVLAPPMDREDLFRLSRSADDVLDNLVDLVREMDLFAITSEELLVEPLKGVADGLASLRDGVEKLVDDPEGSRERSSEAKRNGVRWAYQRGVAELLSGDDDAVTALTHKRRMLLRRVDVVGLRLGEAADALADGTIKRNQ
ncbi:DUF47 domain-containing protein [Salsipaludibacter albus]|uniref:DUF47 domain-containing protein n=1 Tax=Salsipaludibacter albus TaxID=2849650 RepID=UPI001EE3BCFF|nr:DUF47 family protein [Salsipaludibacter albus]MBY5164167.1 DUF47 family protein [Salsipaludibacter albus]